MSLQEPGPKPRRKGCCSFFLRPGVMVTVLTLINVVNYLDRYIIPGASKSVEAYIQVALDTEEVSFYLGLLTSSFIVGYSIASLTFGHLVHFFPPFRLLTVGLLIWIIAVLTSAFASNFWLLIAARALSGVGEASFNTIAPPFIDDNAPPESRGKWLAAFYAAIPVGTAIGFSYSSIVAANLRWQDAFLFEVPVMFPFLIICALVPNDYYTGKERADARSRSSSAEERVSLIAEDSVDEEEQLTLWAQTKIVMAEPVFTTVTLAYAAQTAVLAGLASFGPIFFLKMQLFKSAEAASTSLGVVVALGGIIGTPLGGILLDKTSDPSPLQRLPIACRQVFICSCLSMAFFMFAPFCQSAAQVLIGLLLGSIVMFSLNSPIATIVMTCVPPSMRGFAIAVETVLLHALGDVPSPLIIGAMEDSFAPEKGSAEMADSGTRKTLLFTMLWLTWTIVFTLWSWRASRRWAIIHKNDPQYKEDGREISSVVSSSYKPPRVESVEAEEALLKR